MSQGQLFDLSHPDQPAKFGTPRSHRNDPATSAEAAANHRESGKHRKHSELVLSLVKRHPGRTACELWELATPAEKVELGDYYEVRRRLSDMSSLALPLVRKAEPRECSVKRTKQVTWELV